MHIACDECQCPHQCLVGAITEKEDDLTDFRRIRSGYRNESVGFISLFQFRLPETFRNHFQNSVLVSSGYGICKFLGLS